MSAPPSWNLTTISVNDAQQALQADGLDTLGLATLALSTRWSDSTPSDYDHNQLTLNLSSIRAPFRGILEFAFTPVRTTVLTAITATDTTLVVAAGDGSKFPSPNGDGPILLTLTSPSSSKIEIVGCTARSGDSFTIVRGVANSTPQAFAPSDVVTLRLGSDNISSDFTGADGAPLSGACAVYRLHPAAVWRLETLIQDRYSPGSAPVLPVPVAMVVRGVEGFKSAEWFEPDNTLTGISGQISFHDGRGLIVDPIYVAALFDDLQIWLAGLTGKTSTAPAAGAGGVHSIASIAMGTLVHLVDLHGGNYQPALPGATFVTKNASGTVTGSVPSSGLFILGPGDGIDSAGSDLGRLRWGHATNGVMGATKLVPPATATLTRPFHRIAAIDTTWALLGNRTTGTVLGIPQDDGTMAPDLLPAVRDNVVIDYLTDGPDTLAQAATVLARPSQQVVLAVSPVLDGSMAVPTAVGANAHWPAFPAPNSNQVFPNPVVSAKDGIVATWTAGQDVVVTLLPDHVPDGAHVRIYPRQFVTIPAIAQEPSFLRGHGGAALATAGTATQVLLPNPFALAPAQPKPSGAHLEMDIVVAPRNGTRKMWGAVSVPVAAGPAVPPADPFAGPNTVQSMLVQMQSIAPSPIFGIPNTITPPGTAPGSVIAFIRALASEGAPRQGPRLPTMARFESILLTGTSGGSPSGTLLWEAVLTGGRWARESRSALHASGNPGNPAGPDVHAPGLHVTGALGYDLARHALRRVQPILPLPGTPGTQPGWVLAMAGDNFNQPQDTSTANTGCGALLSTVAAYCETPELSLFTPPGPGATLQTIANSLASSLGVTAPTIPATGNSTRVIAEIRREVVVSKSGARDALWSLRRALREARELIYIESPQFARTARASGSPTLEQVDLVQEIVASLAAHPKLRVVVCTPRDADFAPNYPGWSRQHYRARSEAVGNLLAAAPERVAVFHPVGFPGRTAFVRTTTVVVDDVWVLSGATHFRRRGMTFDGSAAIASFDRELDNGYSKKVRAFRRGLMAAKMGIAPPTGSPTSPWLRLGKPRSAFELVRDWLSEGGLGAILPLWPGPSDTTVLPATDDMADPDGSDGTTFLGLLGSLIAESGH